MKWPAVSISSLDLREARGSAVAIKLMESIWERSGMIRILCRDEAQAELVDRAAGRARERGLTSATVVTEVRS